MRGTKSFLDPIYKEQIRCLEKDRRFSLKSVCPVVDLFKADIFSLGVTLY